MIKFNGEGEGISWRCEGGCRPDRVAEFCAAIDDVHSRLADNLEAIDRENGLNYDHSGLRVPTAELIGGMK